MLRCSLWLSPFLNNAFAIDGDDDDVVVTPVTVAGGAVNFTGSITDAPCAIDNGAAGLAVELGQYRSADFSKSGDVSGAKTFTIGLNNCAVDTYSKATVTFSGVTESGKPKVLSLEGGSGSASGVGIQIMKNNTALAVDGTEASEATSLTEGKSSLAFQAQYIALADTVTPGSANASANFTITYL